MRECCRFFVTSFCQSCRGQLSLQGLSTNGVASVEYTYVDLPFCRCGLCKKKKKKVIKLIAFGRDLNREGELREGHTPGNQIDFASGKRKTSSHI